MVDMTRLECRDCFQEALYTIGIYNDRKIRRDEMKAFRQAYENEFYYNHEDPNGPKSRIVPLKA